MSSAVPPLHKPEVFHNACGHIYYILQFCVLIVACGFLLIRESQGVQSLVRKDIHGWRVFMLGPLSIFEIFSDKRLT